MDSIVRRCLLPAVKPRRFERDRWRWKVLLWDDKSGLFSFKSRHIRTKGHDLLFRNHSQPIRIPYILIFKWEINQNNHRCPKWGLWRGCLGSVSRPRRVRKAIYKSRSAPDMFGFLLILSCVQKNFHPANRLQMLDSTAAFSMRKSSIEGEV